MVNIEATRASVSVGPLFKHQEIARFFPENLSGGVLDVGGFANNQFLRRVLPEGLVTTSVNLWPETHGRMADIIGDGRRLPFSDEAFSLTTAVEVLEHVFPPQRRAVVREMMRVAREGAVICTPIHSGRNVRFELDLVEKMREVDLPPKKSTFEHRLLGLPSFADLVEIGRHMRVPFSLHPSTVSSTLFQSLYDQVEILAAGANDQSQAIARKIADNAEKILMQVPSVSWEDAYRAIMVLRKNQPGQIIKDEQALFLSRNELMAYPAALRQAGWWYVRPGDVIQFCKENPLRGRNIVVEGPEGSGKTSLVRALVQRLQEWGYDIAVQTDYGLRQRIREMEKKMKRVISDPERAEFFAFAMIEASVSGNAFSLLGPCKLSINDRGVESVKMHHGWHCPDNVTIPFLLEESYPLRIPPDLTIVLLVPDKEQNFYLMQKDGDLVNQTKGPDALAYQRKFYEKLILGNGTEYTGPVCFIRNPGKEGSFSEVIFQALEAIEHYCKIPTSR